MSSLDFIGATSPALPPHALPPIVMSAGVGILGAVLWRAHPVLGFLGASALASNAYDLATRRQTWKQTGLRVGKHVAAVAGSLALHSHPAIGYVAGAVAADLLIDGKGGGVMEEWAHRTGLAPGQPEIIDAVAVN